MEKRVYIVGDDESANKIMQGDCPSIVVMSTKYFESIMPSEQDVPMKVLFGASVKIDQ